MRVSVLPEPPYYMVSFTSQRTDAEDGYGEIGYAMSELASQQPGYLGFESVRSADGFGILLSFWKDEQGIRAWKADVDHVDAQRRGRQDWYSRYEIRVAVVQRAYGFDREPVTAADAGSNASKRPLRADRSLYARIILRGEF